MNEDSLSVGTWVLMRYGLGKQEFCVLDKIEDHVLLGKPDWVVSSAGWFSISELKAKNAFITGKGKYRWWRHIIPAPNDLIFPYSNPDRKG